MNLSNWSGAHTLLIVLGGFVVIGSWLVQQGVLSASIAAGITTALVVIKTVIGLFTPSVSAPKAVQP